MTRLLAVDVDGTLHSGDLAWQGFWWLTLRRPYLFFWLVALALYDRIALKQFIAKRAQLDFAKLNWHKEVIDYLVEQQQERQLVLATAAAELHAHQCSEYLATNFGIKFAFVLASANKVNLHSQAKAAALKNLNPTAGFDYIGDSPKQDPPVFSEATVCHLVNPTNVLKQQFASSESKIFLTKLSVGAKLRRQLLAFLHTGSST